MNPGLSQGGAADWRQVLARVMLWLVLNAAFVVAVWLGLRFGVLDWDHEALLPWYFVIQPAFSGLACVIVPRRERIPANSGQHVRAGAPAPSGQDSPKRGRVVAVPVLVGLPLLTYLMSVIFFMAQGHTLGWAAYCVATYGVVGGEFVVAVIPAVGGLMLLRMRGRFSRKVSPVPTPSAPAVGGVGFDQGGVGAASGAPADQPMVMAPTTASAARVTRSEGLADVGVPGDGGGLGLPLGLVSAGVGAVAAATAVLWALGVEVRGGLGWTVVSALVVVQPLLAWGSLRALGRRVGRLIGVGEPRVGGAVNAPAVGLPVRLWLACWAALSAGVWIWLALLDVLPAGGALAAGLVLQPLVVATSFVLALGFTQIRSRSGTLPSSQVLTGPRRTEASRSARALQAPEVASLYAWMLVSSATGVLAAWGLPQPWSPRIGPEGAVGLLVVVSVVHVGCAWILCRLLPSHGRKGTVAHHAPPIAVHQPADRHAALVARPAVQRTTVHVVATAIAAWCVLTWSVGAWTFGLAGGHLLMVGLLLAVAQVAVIPSAVSSAWLLHAGARP